ncbi:MAG: hypothetical protein WD595_03960 [Waddliaceae bacterium]
MQLNTPNTFNLFANRYRKDKNDDFLHLLSSEDADSLKNASHHHTDLSLVFPVSHRHLENVHYSWLIPIFQKLNPQLLPYAIAIIPEEQREKLAETLSVKEYPTALPPPICRFLYTKLFPIINDELHLASCDLSTSPLSPIFDFSKQMLLEMIDLLGMFELTEIIKKIVDKTRLQKIYHCLNQEEKKFLLQLQKEKRPLFSIKISLNQWDGSISQLRKLIHKVGMIRLAGALSGENDDFIYAFLHRLDIGRGRHLLKLLEKKEIKTNKKTMMKQTRQLLEFLKQDKKQ